MQHVLASMNDPSTSSGQAGRAAVVLDTGAASRGSGNANTNKEKDVRKWFVEQDLIEGVIYLPENLFYNTTAPGIIIVLNKAKPKERRGNLFLLNASRDFVKGDPKNYIPDDSVARIDG
jgi:type I restriction enzyme M protein